MRSALEPPVHAGELDAQLGGRLEDVQAAAVGGLLDVGDVARATGLGEDAPRPRQDPIGVLDELVRVPRQEELPVLAQVAPAVVPEKSRLPLPRVVVAGVVRPAVSPFGPSDRLCGVLKPLQHVFVEALELTHAREPPPPVSLRVGRVPQLPGRPEPDGDLGDGVPHEVVEFVRECRDKIRVRLERSPPEQARHLVAAERDVLRVPVAPGVCVENVWIKLCRVVHPRRQRDRARVPHVPSRRVEAHNGLHLEPLGQDLLEERPIGREIVLLRPQVLCDTPPHVHHDPLHPRRPQHLQPHVNSVFPHQHALQVIRRRRRRRLR